jgi:hypothetical protein
MSIAHEIRNTKPTSASAHHQGVSQPMSTEETDAAVEYRDALQTLLDHRDRLGVPAPVSKAIQTTLAEDFEGAEKLWAELRPSEGSHINHWRSATGWDLTAEVGSDLDRVLAEDLSYTLVAAGTPRPTEPKHADWMFGVGPASAPAGIH